MPLSDPQLVFVERYLTRKLPVPAKVLAPVAPVVAGPDSGSTAAPDAPSYASEDLEEVRRDLEDLRKQVSYLRTDVVTHLGAPLTELTEAYDKIDELLNQADALGDATAINGLLNRADKAIPAPMARLEELKKAKAAYLAELPQAEGLSQALKAHPKYAEVDLAKRNAADDALALAKSEATKLDFVKALAALKDFDTKRRAAREEADKAARFAVVLDARKTAKAKLETDYAALDWEGEPIPPSLAQQFLDAKKLVDEGETEGAPTGLAKLDQFPAAETALRATMQKARYYVTRVTGVRDMVTRLQTTLPPFVAMAEVDFLDDEVGKAETAAAGDDYAKASDILKMCYAKAVQIYGRESDHKDCSDRIQEFKILQPGYAGLSGDPADGLKAKYGTLITQAETKLAAFDFGAVRARLKELDKIASHLKTLNNAIGDTTTTINGKKVPPEDTYLAALFSQTDEMLAEAERLRLAGKHEEALKICEQVDTMAGEVDSYYKTSLTAATTDKANIDALLLNMAANGATAVNELKTALTNWGGSLPANFTTAFGGACAYSSDPFQEAADLAFDAEHALNDAPPRLNDAKLALEDGTDKLVEAGQAALAAIAYESYKQDVEKIKAGITRINGWNDVAYDGADLDITDSQTAAHDHNYALAGTKLRDAEQKLAEAARFEKGHNGYSDAVGGLGFGGIVPAECDMVAINADYLLLDQKKKDLDDAWNTDKVDLAERLEKELKTESAQLYVVGCAAKLATDIAAVRALRTGKAWAAKHQPVEDALVEIERQIQAGVDKKDRGLAEEAQIDLYRLIGKVGLEKTRAEAINSYHDDKAAVELKVTALETPRDEVLPNAAAAKLVQDLKDKLTAATEAVDKGDGPRAATLLGEADTGAGTAATALAAMKTCKGNIEAAQKRHDKLKMAEAVEHEFDIASGLLIEARTALNDGRTTEAEALVTKAGLSLTTAETVLAGHKQVSDGRDAARDLANGAADVGAEDLKPLIEKAEQGEARVLGRLPAMECQKPFPKAIAARLAEGKGTPSKAAADALATCLSHILRADTLAAQYENFDAEKTRILGLIPAIEGIDKGGDFVKPELDSVRKNLGFYTGRAHESDFQAAFPGLRSEEHDLALARAKAEAFKAYDTRSKGEVKDAIKAIKEHEHRFAVTEEIDDIDGLLAEAAKHVTARDTVRAVDALDEIMAICALCDVKLKVSKGEAPDEDLLRKMAQMKDGPAYLDKFVEELDPRIHREALINVTKARFGLDEMGFYAAEVDNVITGPSAEGTAVPAVNLRAMFDMMKQVPDKYTRESDSLKKLQNFDASDSSYYWGKEKVIAMFAGRAYDKNPVAVSASWEVDRSPLPGEVRDPSIVVDHVDASAPVPDYFGWTVWHELAHSIDDKLGFMNARMGNSKYGGWQQHGRDVKPIADAAAAHFGCNNAPSRNYIELLLRHQTPEAPDETDMPLEKRMDVHAWYEAVKEAGNPWDSSSISRANALGGRMYHEAYGNSWVSYDLKQRALAVTGYQFRAPGEWFSELYAALKVGKLKNSHPVYDELNAL